MAIDSDQNELLLPWLANETLDQSEREQVEQYLADHPEQQDELAFLKSLRAGVKQEQPGSPGAFGLRRLQREIRAGKSGTAPLVSTQPAANDSRWWKMSLAAAVMVAIVQGGLLLNLDRSQDDRIRPLSSAQTPQAVIQIEFHPTATEQRIRELLAAASVRIVDGPSALGLYRLGIAQDDDGNPDLDSVLQELRAADEIVKYVGQN